MAETVELEVERQPLRTFAEKAYLDYSMYVILDRALPHIGDGLKPVQRRIVYAMSELGLSAQSKPKKAARTVGDVLGKYHPHGDLACYEAMVIMAQPFNYRYPLVDGQGNWGSADDPKSFAAMRYTESRLTPYAKTLLAELDQGTVDWAPNFDGSLTEPKLLPARLPNLLLNGTTGIAVGMSTDIPPHNMAEVAKACIHLLKHPKASLDDITQHMPAPDYPTGGRIITPLAEIREIYETGNGMLRQRAKWTREKGGDIVIYALPYQVSGSKVLEQIAGQMQAKKLPTVADLRDESDHENPTRLVIEPRSNRVDVEALMAHLFATTDLEKGYRVNLNVIGLDGKPQVKPLLPLLKEWLKFRTDTVTRRLQHRLDAVTDRLHILEGLLTAYLNIDEVIKIIRTEDDPKAVLMKRFELTGTQADAILDLRLRHLMKLEEMKIKGEQEELEAERKTLEATLKSKAKLKKLIAAEIQADAEEYGDARRCELVEEEVVEAQAYAEEDLLPTEPITVVLSQQGWIRAAKGHDVDAASLSYKSGDEFLASAAGKTNQSLVVFDSTGRSYSLAARKLPTARGHGEPLSRQLSAADGARFIGVMLGSAEQKYLLASDAAYGFIAALGDLEAKTRTGKQVLIVPKGGIALAPQPIFGMEDLLAVATTEGRLLIYPVAELPEMAKGKGNKLIDVKKDDRVAAITVIGPSTELRLYSGKRSLHLKLRDIEVYRGTRAQRGKKLPQGFRNVFAAEAVME